MALLKEQTLGGKLIDLKDVRNQRTTKSKMPFGSNLAHHQDSISDKRLEYLTLFDLQALSATAVAAA